MGTNRATAVLLRLLRWANAIKTGFEWKAILFGGSMGGLTTALTWASRDPAVAVIFGMIAFGVAVIVLWLTSMAASSLSEYLVEIAPKPAQGAFSPAFHPIERSTRQAYRFTEETKANRVFAARTYAEMCSELAKITPSFKQREAAEQLCGFWVPVLGCVTDVPGDDGSDVVQVTLIDPATEIRIGLLLEMKWRQLARTLRPGIDYLKANGAINNIGGTWVSLVPVELIAYGPENGMIQV